MYRNHELYASFKPHRKYGKEHNTLVTAGLEPTVFIQCAKRALVWVGRILTNSGRRSNIHPTSEAFRHKANAQRIQIVYIDQYVVTRLKKISKTSAFLSANPYANEYNACPTCHERSNHNVHERTSEFPRTLDTRSSMTSSVLTLMVA